MITTATVMSTVTSSRLGILYNTFLTDYRLAPEPQLGLGNLRRYIRHFSLAHDQAVMRLKKNRNLSLMG